MFFGYWFIFPKNGLSLYPWFIGKLDVDSGTGRKITACCGNFYETIEYKEADLFDGLFKIVEQFKDGIIVDCGW